VETRREQVAELLKLLREILREPTFPADELTRLVHQRVANAQENALQPQTLANRALTRYLTPYPADDIRYPQDEAEYAASAQKIRHDDLAAFWRDYVGGDHAYFAAVGDFDPTELKRLMSDYFADWTSSKRYVPLPEPWQDIPARVQLIETPDKANANLRGGLRIPAGERHADYPALLLATHLLGGGFLSSRLATRIRQKEGISTTLTPRSYPVPVRPIASFTFLQSTRRRIAPGWRTLCVKSCSACSRMASARRNLPMAKRAISKRVAWRARRMKT
jgi:zinc protease